jgi:hypothetical protein
MPTGIGDEIGWWCPSLDSSGNGTTTLNDLSGNGLHATINTMDATAAWVTDSSDGGSKAIYLDGSMDYIQIAHDALLDFERTDAFSLTGWIKTSTSGAYGVFSKLDSSSPYRGYEFWLSSGTTQINLYNTWSSNYLQVQVASGTYNPLGSAWKPFALVYDGSSTYGGIKVYWEGVSRTLTNNNNTLSATIKNTLPLFIGARGGAFVAEMRIDDFRVYDRALSQDEVEHLHSARAVEGGLSEDITITNSQTISQSELPELSVEDSIEGGYYTFSEEEYVLQGQTGIINQGWYLRDDASYVGGMGTTVDTLKGGEEAFVFDGSNDYIQLPATNTILNNDNLIISVWVKYTHTTNDSRIFTSHRADAPSTGTLLGLNIDGSGNLGVTYRNVADSDFIDIHTSFPCNDGDWHHVVVTITTYEVNLYVDGALIGTNAGMSTLRGTQIASIGAFRNDDGSSTNNWLGRIDDFRIFLNALSHEDILLLERRRLSIRPSEYIITADSHAVGYELSYAPPSYFTSGGLSSSNEGDADWKVDADHVTSAFALQFIYPDPDDDESYVKNLRTSGEFNLANMVSEGTVLWRATLKLTAYAADATSNTYPYLEGKHRVGVLDSGTQELPSDYSGVLSATPVSAFAQTIGNSGSLDNYIGNSFDQVYIDLTNNIWAANNSGHFNNEDNIIILCKPIVDDPDDYFRLFAKGHDDSDDGYRPQLILQWFPPEPIDPEDITVVNSQTRSHSEVPTLITVYDVTIINSETKSESNSVTLTVEIDLGVTNSQTRSQSSIGSLGLIYDIYVIDSQTVSQSYTPRVKILYEVDSIIASQTVSQSLLPEIDGNLFLSTTTPSQTLSQSYKPAISILTAGFVNRSLIPNGLLPG